MPVLHPSRVIDLIHHAAAKNDIPSSARRQQLLQVTADEVKAAGQPYTSVYLYMLHEDELVLEAFAGRITEHERIRVGHGVCGTAMAEGRNQNVPDVTARGNYIACNHFTKSELVVLLRKNGVILGQIDVDSDVLDPFSAEEEAALNAVADALGSLL